MVINLETVMGVPEQVTVKSKAKTERALSGFLRPEFLNRVDAVITFRRLDREDFIRIADIQMKKMKDALAEQGITLSYTKEALRVIAESSYSEKYGARNMRRYIQKEIEDVLAERIIESRASSMTVAQVSVKNGKLSVVCL